MKRACAAVLFAWAGFLFSSPLFSLPGRFFRFERLVPESRGTAAGVSSMLQDGRGYLWFGTNLGLVRYDGYRFDFFSPNSGPEAASPPVVVYPILLDSAGDIWLGTAGQGLFCFDRETETFFQYRYASTAPPESGGEIVLAIQEDGNRDLWVGTRLDGLYRFDRKTRIFDRISLDPEAGAVWDLLVDREGFLWIATQESGLFRRNPATGETVNFRFMLDGPRSLGSNTVWTIFQDRREAIWVGTRGGGLNRYVPEREEFIRFAGDAAHPQDLISPSITALAEDAAGRLWIGTSWSGLRIWDRTTGEYTILKHDPQDPDTIADNNVTSILKDGSGIMWVGTTRGGVNKSLADQVKFAHRKHNRHDPLSISRNDVRCLWKSDSGKLWVGFDEGLDEIDEQTGQIRRFRGDPSDAGSFSSGATVALLEDGKGRVWAGLEGGGLDCLDCRTGRITRRRNNPADPESLSNDKVYAILQDRADPGVLWIGTHQGLNRLDTRTGRFTRYLSDASNPASLSGSIITAILEDRSGNLWIGTRSGLNRMDKLTERFERHVGDIKNPSGTGPNDNIINCIHEDGAGILWLGTDGGLNRFDRRAGEWRYYTAREGLPGEVVCGILEDESGFFWVSTNRGLARFNPFTGAFTGFGLHDGIQGNQFNRGACFRSADGRMYFGGVNGFNVFHPGAVRIDPFIPPVVWTGFYQNNQRVGTPQPLSRLQALKLPYRARFVSFEFAALSFLSPPLNRYAYKLEPRDDEWINLGHDHAVSFADLPSGRHLLRVKGASPDGAWNEEGISIILTVTPPFWRTTWFFAVVFLFAASGAATIVITWKKVRSAYRQAAPNLDEFIEKYLITAREAEILRLILQGASNKDMARKLFISASTVRNHIYNIYQKLGVRNKIELINRIGKDARKKG